MKVILFLVTTAALFTTTGCLFPGHRGEGEDRGRGQYRDHEEYREHSENRVYPGIDVAPERLMATARLA